VRAPSFRQECEGRSEDRETYGITLGTLTQYSATPGTQVAGGTKH